MSAISRQRRYFDNAATSFPKPPGVVEAVRDYMMHVGASAGRGGYAEAVASQALLDETRGAVRRLFNCNEHDHVIFTLNGTDALNMGLKSLVRPGAHVVTTVMDHNSVLRPLAALRARLGVTWTAVSVDPVTTRMDPSDLERAISRETGLVIVNHASNVTGVLQPIADIAAICRRRGVPLMIDAAQSAGHVPIDFAGLGLDMLACPGHKGLLGPLGTGILLVRAGLESRLQTVREGGTGSQSERPVQPEALPDKFEAGSHNAPGLAGLRAALAWIAERGVAFLRRHELELSEQLLAALRDIEGLRVFGPRLAAERVGVFSVRSDRVPPAELSRTLEGEFGVLTRSGLHCAPFAHQAIGTDATGGTTRLSLGPFIVPGDVEHAVEALRAACGAARRAKRREAGVSV